MDSSGDGPVVLDAILVAVNVSLRWKSLAAAAADYRASSVHISCSMLAVHPDLSLQCSLSHFAVAAPIQQQGVLIVLATRRSLSRNRRESFSVGEYSTVRSSV